MPSPSSSSGASSTHSSDSESTLVKPTSKRKQPVTNVTSASSHSDDSEDSESANSSDDDEPTGPAEDDEPVLSHAEKRRQKKKEEKLANGTSTKGESDPKVQTRVKNTAEITPSKIPKRQNSVWIGNMAFKTTAESLRKFFDGVGEITRVHMPMKLTNSNNSVIKENRGFAYVDFATPESKAIAVTLSEKHLDGRKLLIKDGSDFSGRPSTSATPADGTSDAATASKPNGLTKTAQKILSSQKQPAGPTLFLGNLGFETTEKSIRDMLTSHRKKDDTEEPMEGEGEKGVKKDTWIRKIRMGTFEDSGKCKGWAFVDFTSTEHATTSLTNPKNYFLDGRKLVVEFASPDAVRRGGGPRGEAKPKRAVEGTDGEPEQGRTRGERTRPKKRTAAQADDEEQQERPSSPKKPKVAQSDQQRVRRDRPEKDNRPRVRAKPGAALANAQRETAAIVPSQGKKIVFS